MEPEIGAGGELLLQARGQIAVDLDDGQFTSARYEWRGQGGVAWADFQYAFSGLGINQSDNTVDDEIVDEKVLPKPFAVVVGLSVDRSVSPRGS